MEDINILNAKFNICNEGDINIPLFLQIKVLLQDDNEFIMALDTNKQLIYSKYIYDTFTNIDRLTVDRVCKEIDTNNIKDKFINYTERCKHNYINEYKQKLLDNCEV